MSDPTWFIVETGDSVADANAYAALEYVDMYHTARGNLYWNLLDTTQKYTCIVKASDYIDKRFTSMFRGMRMQRDQGMAWPRLAAYDDDKFSITGIPLQLKKAVAEYALRAAIYNVLAPDAPRSVRSQDMSAEAPNSTEEIISGPVQLKTEKVGPIEQTTRYDTPSQSRIPITTTRTSQSNVVNDLFVPQYPEADLFIEPLLVQGASITMERA